MAEATSRWDQKKFITSSEQETTELARAFAGTLQQPCAVLLFGELGSGKTTFTRGLVAGLGMPDAGLVRSPSFTLVNVYQGPLPIYHVDLYRLETLRDLETIGLDEILTQDAVVIIEWAEKLAVQPETGWKVVISDLGETSREIRFSRIETAA